MGLKSNERRPFVDALVRLRPNLYDVVKRLDGPFSSLADFAKLQNNGS